MSGVNGPRGSFRLQHQQCVDETNNSVSPDIVTSDHVTSDHATSDHTTSDQISPDHLARINQGALNILSTIRESSSAENPDLVMVSNHTSNGSTDHVNPNQLLEEQSRRLQEIMTIQEATTKILQLCSQKSRQPVHDSNYRRAHSMN